MLCRAHHRKRVCVNVKDPQQLGLFGIDYRVEAQVQPVLVDLRFDVAMLTRALFPMLGQGLPQPKIEVSGLYYDYKFKQLPTHQRQNNPSIDLRFATLMNDLGLPLRYAHDSLNDAVMAALAFIKLHQLHGG